jgi:tetratricopeptide (TPR) repeat protein
LGYGVASAIFLGKYDVFGELFPEILSIEPTPDVAGLIEQALYSVFIMFIVSGQSANALPYVRRMVAIADKYRDVDLMTAAWTEFALMFAAREIQNDLWTARQHNLAAADRYAAAGAREYQAITNAHLGLSCMQLGLRTEAEELFNRVLDTPGAGNLAYMYATYYKSRLLVDRIRFDEALISTAKLAKDALAASDFVMLWCARLLMVGIFAASGKLDEADTILDELGEANAFLPFLRARFLSLRADILRRRGRAEEAVAIAAESVEVGRLGPRYNYGQDPLRLQYALILHAVGRLEDARKVIGEARDDLLATAAKIPDEAVRYAYVENIGMHARTLEMASKWAEENGSRAE